MSENTAYVIDIVVGTLLSCGVVILLSALGASSGLQALVGVWGLIITAFMVGVIGIHYGEKRGEIPPKDDC